MDFKQKYLEKYFEAIASKEFYRSIFPEGELQKKGVYGDNKYNAIAVELGEDKIRRYTITDDLDMIDELLQSENFIIVSPITYVGKSRNSDNARMMYALAIDLDGVNKEINIIDLFHQVEKVEHLPRPTYTVISGGGLHLYYVFKDPIPLFKNIVQQLTNLKNDLTRKIWNGYVTDLNDKVQYQSIFQGFRLVGGVTKSGSRTKAYKTGEKVTVEYLNEFVFDSKNQVKEFTYKSSLTLEEARNKFPEWYERRIIEQKPRGTWICKRDLYDWWQRRLLEIQEGHRYYGVMCLAIYAKKCGIPEKELEADAFGMVERLDLLTSNEDNHFTREDVLAALELYNDNYITFPIDTISKLTEIRIDKNKRNGRKLDQHIKMVNSLRVMRRDVLGENEYKNSGRPTVQDKVNQWKREHPNGKKADCIRETGLSKPTVYKWWWTSE
jgi:hypothetical protein